jgi:hypothetical protein
MDVERFVTALPQPVFDDEGRELCVWIEVKIDPYSGLVIDYQVHTTDEKDRPRGRLH